MIDVVVVGGGPAGLGLAGALARRDRSVVVFERTSYAEPRVGETFGGEIAPALRALGAWEAMSDFARGQVPFRGVQSAWGSDLLEERSSMLHPLGEGWHVERARFDERLAQWATSVGAIVRAGAGACAAARIEGGFRVTPSSGDPVDARYLVDASGRGAPASASLAVRRWVACDRQVALVARATPSSDDAVGSDLLLESVEDGWWYSVPQPDGALVVALVTDADLVPAGGRSGLGARFADALARTTHTRARVRDPAAVRVVRADSGRVLPDRGPAWRAVGDAAMACDPLSGNGVPRALRAAADVADAVLRELDGEAPSTSTLDRRFSDYLDRRASYYELEARWPDALFWARRRAVDWRRAPLTLDPEMPLVWSADVPLAEVEALVPPRAIAALRTMLLRGAEPAHAVLAHLRERAPLGDRRLLVGLQALIERGALRGPAPHATPRAAAPPEGSEA